VTFCRAEYILLLGAGGEDAINWFPTGHHLIIKQPEFMQEFNLRLRAVSGDTVWARRLQMYAINGVAKIFPGPSSYCKGNVLAWFYPVG